MAVPVLAPSAFPARALGRGWTEDRIRQADQTGADANPEREIIELACDRERVAFIFNPASGQGNAALRQSQIERLLRRAGLTCGLTVTSQDRGAGPLAQEAVRDGMERVIVSGGDGSVTEAAEALAGTGVALGIVPGGTGNLVALNLGIPADTDAAVRLALTGRPTAIDIGCCNDTPFVLMAGLGWDARLIQDADRRLKNRLGVLAYFWAALRNVAHPSTAYHLRIDGRTLRRRAKSVIVANLGRITGGLQVIPGTHPRDGFLEVAILRAESQIDFVGLLWSALRGKMREDARLEIFRGREIVVETSHPQPLQLDGNEAGETARAEIRIQQRALCVVLPAG
jgi:diacylglycerol kinase (ATP)